MGSQDNTPGLTPQETSLVKDLTAALQQGGQDGLKQWNMAMSKWQATHGENAYVPLAGVNAKDVDLTGFNLRQVILEHPRFEHCRFTDTRFDHSQIRDGNFTDCTFTDVSISRSVLDHTTMSGSFTGLRIQESLLANDCFEGKFLRKPGDPNSANVVSYNKLVTCTDFLRMTEKGEPLALDLQNGPLQVTYNVAPEMQNPPRKDPSRDHGLHNVHVTSVTPDGQSLEHSLSDAKLNNSVFQPMRGGQACDANLGNVYDITNYPPPLTDKQVRKQDRALRKDERADQAALNVQTDLYRHGFGISGTESLAFTDGLKIARGEDWLLTGGFGMQQAKLGTMELTHAGIGPHYSWVGYNKEGRANVSYKATLNMGGGNLSFKDPHHSRGGNEETSQEFSQKFVGVIPGFEVGMWRGNLGLKGEVQWPISLATSNSMQDGNRRNPNNNYSNDTYKITMTDMKLGPIVSGSLHYNFYPMMTHHNGSSSVVSVFVRGDAFANNQITYDAQTTINGQTDIVHGLQQKSGVKFAGAVGVNLGF